MGVPGDRKGKSASSSRLRPDPGRTHDQDPDEDDSASVMLGAVRPLTARQLNRATLARQMLLEREPIGVVEAVRRIVAVQAQEAASPYIALWNRVADFDPADLDAAFVDHA